MSLCSVSCCFVLKGVQTDTFFLEKTQPPMESTHVGTQGSTQSFSSVQRGSPETSARGSQCQCQHLLPNTGRNSWWPQHRTGCGSVTSQHPDDARHSSQVSPSCPQTRATHNPALPRTRRRSLRATLSVLTLVRSQARWDGLKAPRTPPAFPHLQGQLPPETSPRPALTQHSQSCVVLRSPSAQAHLHGAPWQPPTTCPGYTFS